MAQPKRILVACGTAIATSTVVAKSIEEEMKKRGIQVITRQCKHRRIAYREERSSRSLYISPQTFHPVTRAASAI